MILFVLIIGFLGGVVYMTYGFVVNGSVWAADRTNQHLYSGGTIKNAGTIYDRNGVMLAESKNDKRVFASSSAVRKAVQHTVGDTSGFISTGTHYFYRDYLSGYNLVDGIYNIIQKQAGNDITLNIDSEANRISYEAFGQYNGAIAVYNYKTGELLCSVSKPSYDPANVPDNLRTDEKYEGVFLDKVVSGLYTPGSIMKIVTAACAIENIPDIYDRSFECDGKYETGDGTVICNGVHGTVNFEQAMNESCNCAFAEIAIELGSKKLTQTAESLGFNRQLSAKEIPLVKSTFASSYETKSELGWAGIGQSVTLVNPSHFLSIIGAIANEGSGYAPDRIKSLGTLSTVMGRSPEILVSISPDTAKKLSILLRSNVVNKYGESKFPGLEMCGKTGTAQVDGAKSHSWFVGYSMKKDLPLAVVCVAENAGYGSGVAASVSNKVMQYFAKNM